MNSAPSATWPIDKAMATAFKADATLSALLTDPKVHNGQASANSGFPYIVLGSSDEDRFALFARAGTTGSTSYQVWTAKPDKRQAQELYSLTKKILDGQRLPMSDDGMLMLRGSVRLIAVLPGDLQARTYRAAAIYSWTVVQAS